MYHPKKHHHMKGRVLPLIAFALLCLPSTLHAATIVFSAAQTISGDTDVLTTGTLAYAFTESNIATTVNGVNFAAGASSSSLGGGNVTFTGFTNFNNTAFTSASAPYSGLSNAYRQTLQGSVFAATGNTLGTVTLNNLTIGQAYQVQVWVQDPRTGGTETRTEVIRNVDDSGSITLDYNSTNGAGGVGQYTIGTFTADATSQSFEMLGAASSQMNAIQLRAIPEPSHLTLLSLAGIATLRRRRR